MNKRFIIITTALEIMLFLWIFMVSTVMALPPPNFVEGRVFDNETGAVISGAEVYVEIAAEYSDEDTTSENGYYMLFLPWDLEGLMVRITAKADGYYQTTKSVKGAYPLYVDLALNSREGLLAATATFSGKVLNSNTGDPVEGNDGRFFLLPRLRPIDVNGYGEFIVRGLTPGFYFPILFYEGYRPWFYLFLLKGGETEVVTIELVPFLKGE
jgi:hypothetical protein